MFNLAFERENIQPPLFYNYSVATMVTRSLKILKQMLGENTLLCIFVTLFSSSIKGDGSVFICLSVSKIPHGLLNGFK